MKKTIVGLIALLVLSCQRGPEAPIERPKDLISTERLIEVIIDLQVLESHYQRQFQRPGTYQKALDSASYFVFERHKVTEDQFERSYEYYAMDVNSMFQIYEAVLDTVNLRISDTEVTQE